MATIRHVATLALCAACARNEPDLYSTFPEPIEVNGPPGGEMDREWRAAAFDDGAGFYAAGGSTELTGSASLTTSCTDGEIDATLAGYGEWIEIEGYGLVWRPYTTAVGVDFTPYETCGSWVWTEWGWTFACEWDWGWLPFHYGRWGWFDDYWAWVPDYEWSPAWVDWRSGGGYVGWRPTPPKVRDHRSTTHAGGGGPIVRDHRTGPRVRDHRGRTASTKDWQWRFAAANDLGKPRIRSHLYKALAEGLRVTSTVLQPPTRASVRAVAASSIMQPRLAFAERARELRSGAVTHGRIDRRVGGRIELAPATPNARVDRRLGVDRSTDARREFGGATRTETIDGARGPAWSRASRDERASEPAWAAPNRSERDESLLSPSAGLEVMPTSPTPSPEPSTGDGYRGPTAQPSREPERYRGAMSDRPTRGSHGEYRGPTAQPSRGSHDEHRGPIAAPPRGSYERYRGPTAEPPRESDRYRGPSAQPPPSRGSYERYRGPTAEPPSRSAPERHNPPPSRSAPERGPVYSPPTRSSPPMSSPPVRSSPMSSSPARSSPMSSSPARSSSPASSPARSSSPASSTRNHRR